MKTWRKTAAVAAAVAALTVAGVGGSNATSNNSVRDGQMEFSLLNWNGHSGVLNVKNIGKTAATYDGGDQRAVDTQGRKFDCDGASQRLQPDESLMDSLSCSNGRVSIDHLEVHDFFLSRGTALPV